MVLIEFPESSEASLVVEGSLMWTMRASSSENEASFCDCGGERKLVDRLDPVRDPWRTADEEKNEMRSREARELVEERRAGRSEAGGKSGSKGRSEFIVIMVCLAT